MHGVHFVERLTKLLLSITLIRRLDAPAPFLLCDLDDLDIREDDSYCPKDRQALVVFYQSTKGSDWITDKNWLASDKHHCTWFGVECDERQTTVLHLSLSRNGLSGRIPSDLFNLTSLESIDFNDNELYGSVPSEIGKLVQLKKLRLSYNELTALPTTFGMLSTLEFLHIHGNRISGDDSFITVNSAASDDEVHAFIADCGDPVDSEEPFACDGCDMCCNAMEECQVPVANSDFSGWVSALLIAAYVLAFQIVTGFIVHFLVKKNVMRPSKTSARSACGDDSVYQFVLSHSVPAWIIMIATILIQLAIFALFLNASIFDSEISDWVYSWRCPRNTEACNDDNLVDNYGWVVWALLVFTSVLQDLANGIKLMNLAASRKSVHCFCGSFLLLSITVLAIYTSAVYNRAIAMSSTELIVNAVILLFVNEIDEQIYNSIQVIAPKWTERIGEQADELSDQLAGKADADSSTRTNGGVDKSASKSDVFYAAETWESTKNLGDSAQESLPKDSAASPQSQPSMDT